MVKYNTSENNYKGKVYFIVPRLIGDNIEDSTVLTIFNQIHKKAAIDYLFIKESEKEKILRGYSSNRGIKVIDILDNEHLTEEINTLCIRGNKNFVYYTNTENASSLDKTLETLFQLGFFSEIRIPNCF